MVKTTDLSTEGVPPNPKLFPSGLLHSPACNHDNVVSILYIAPLFFFHVTANYATPVLIELRRVRIHLLRIFIVKLVRHIQNQHHQ